MSHPILLLHHILHHDKGCPSWLIASGRIAGGVIPLRPRSQVLIPLFSYLASSEWRHFVFTDVRTPHHIFCLLIIFMCLCIRSRYLGVGSRSRRHVITVQTPNKLSMSVRALKKQQNQPSRFFRQTHTLSLSIDFERRPSYFIVMMF